jgi:hypothetical protein
MGMFLFVHAPSSLSAMCTFIVLFIFFFYTLDELSEEREKSAKRLSVRHTRAMVRPHILRENMLTRTTTLTTQVDDDDEMR